MALWANVINTVSMVDNTNAIDSLELSKRLLYKLGTIQILRKHVFGLFSPYPPTL